MHPDLSPAHFLYPEPRASLTTQDHREPSLATRRCIDLLRRTRSQINERSVDAQDLADPFDAEPAPSPEQVAALKQQQEALRTFVSQLGKPQQNFVELCFVNNLDYAHIAKKLGITKLRCRYLKKVILSRARKNAVLLKALDRWPPAEVNGAS